MNLTREYVIQLSNDYTYKPAPVIGHLTPQAIRDLAHWKSARPARHIARNSDDQIASVIAAMNAVGDDPFGVKRIKLLTGLCGISLRTASAILHLGLPELRLPLLDWRAWSSLYGEDKRTFTLTDWIGYVRDCRQLAVRLDVSMRQLDRALWQHSKRADILSKRSLRAEQGRKTHEHRAAHSLPCR